MAQIRHFYGGFVMPVAENSESLHCKADSEPCRSRQIEARNRSEGKEARFIGPVIFHLYGFFKRYSLKKPERFLSPTGW